MLEQKANIISRDRKALNPYVSDLAARLVKTAARADLKVDSVGWELITEVLSFAASAEQRMSEQQERIAFLEELSVTDELTGIPNRRGLKHALRQSLSLAARHNEKGVLGFIDLNGFKIINDTLGHMAGDAVLRHVARLLKKLVRPSDTVARISGDEFAVIFHRCDRQEGMDRIQEVREKLNNSFAKYGHQEIAIACSVGAEEFDGKTDPTTLFEAADMAMYKDKNTNR